MRKLWSNTRACKQSRRWNKLKTALILRVLKLCSEGLMTIRELPFRSYRGRSNANLDARDEAKKHNVSEKQKVRSNTLGYDMAVAFLLAMRSST